MKHLKHFYFLCLNSNLLVIATDMPASTVFSLEGTKETQDFTMTVNYGVTLFSISILFSRLVFICLKAVTANGCLQLAEAGSYH